MRTLNLVLACLFLFTLSACGQKNVVKTQKELGIKVNLTNLDGPMLRNTAKNFDQHYAQKEQGQKISEDQALTIQELTGVKNPQKILENTAKKIGADVFYLELENSNEANQIMEKYTVYKNGQAVFKFQSTPVACASSLISARVIGNKYTVEYLENTINQNGLERKQFIWQDGAESLNQKYALQNAIMPFELKGKLAFLAQKDNQWFVMFDGQKVTDNFERIDFDYCAEPALFKPRAFSYRYYVFFATQANKQKLVEIDAGK